MWKKCLFKKMASILKWSIIMFVYLMKAFKASAGLMARSFRVFKSILSVHRSKAWLAVTLVLGILNLDLLNRHCLDLQPYLIRKLDHGYIPVFPYHFFHLPDKAKSTADPMLNDVNNFLFENLVTDSLTKPVPPVVHVVWCDGGPFTFTHYLSVLGAFKLFKPSVLYLHVKREPELDPDGYFQFLPDLLRDIPVLLKTTLKYRKACSDEYHVQLKSYLQIVGATGGVVIDSRAILTPSPATSAALNRQITVASLKGGRLKLLALFAKSEALPDEYMLDTLLSSKSGGQIFCDNVNTFHVHSSNGCVFVHEDLFPVGILNGSSHFSQIARWVGYGQTEKLLSKPASPKEIVPNIVHYVWLGRRPLDFFAYLSILSSVYVLEAEAVYIHGEAPFGEFWDKIKVNPKVFVILRDFPNSVYGQPIKKFVSHASDYLRADVLLRYGGVYADWDVVFLKKLTASMRRHNATAAVDWPVTGAFPDVFNMGVLVAAPGAPYLRFFLESYRWYLDHHWSYNAIHIPYKVYEKQPQTLNVDRSLQVLCAEGNCHASWLEDYKDENVCHLRSKRFNWQTDAVALHWTHPDPVEFTSMEALRSSTSVLGDIGKNVFRKAGIEM